MKFLIPLLFLFSTNLAFSAIPKTNMILQRTVENSGSGYYQIDLELQFPNGQDPLVLKETWMIEDENNMKVLITGVKDFRDQVVALITVTNGVRIFGNNSRKTSEDFFEKYFHFRSLEHIGHALSQMKIIPPNAHLQKNLRSLKDIDLNSEPFVRLSRTNGIIAYAFGSPADPESSEQIFPGFWIEQDQFVIRKIRTSSGMELSADRYSPFARGLNYPRARTIRWAGQQVVIQTLNVGPRNKAQYQSFGQKVVSKPESFTLLPNASFVEDFYKRFR